MTLETTKDTSAPSNSNQQKPPSGRADIALGIIISAFAIFLYILTNSWATSAAIFPRIIAGILFVLGLINAWQGFSRLSNTSQTLFLPKPIEFLKVWVAILLYFATVWLLGFSISTVLLVVGLSYLFGFTKWYLSLLAGIIFVIVMLSVFTGLFDRPLPIGLIFAPFFD